MSAFWLRLVLTPELPVSEPEMARQVERVIWTVNNMGVCVRRTMQRPRVCWPLSVFRGAVVSPERRQDGLRDCVGPRTTASIDGYRCFLPSSVAR